MHPRYHVPMTSTTHRDLGHGVRVLPGDGNGLVVLSESLDLGWRARVGGASGSAVMWQGSGFEVVDREPWRRGARWRLEPWTGGDVMRVVLPLDEAAIGSAAKAARLAALSTRIRPWLWLLSPVLGFAPAAWQRRWRNTWGYPATIATWLSALLELAVGAAGVIETISAMGAGVSIFPWIPRPIVFISLVLFVEGLIRLAQMAADSEPVGSVFGLVAAVFERRSPKVEEPTPRAVGGGIRRNRRHPRTPVADPAPRLGGSGPVALSGRCIRARGDDEARREAGSIILPRWMPPMSGLDPFTGFCCPGRRWRGGPSRTSPASSRRCC